MSTRTMYESETDRKNEEEMKVVLQRHLIINLQKLPISYRVDFAGFRSRDLICFLEVKCRTHKSDEFDTLILSLLKVKEGLSLSETTGKPFYLASRFTDGVFLMCLNREDVQSFDIKWGGRTDQYRSSGDIEPVLHIPVVKMERISDAKEQK